MLTAVAFLGAIGLLVVVHELGHYAMARACGVKVLQFSVGFGPRVFGWRSRKSGTEFVVSALPLGGFVKMLDESEGSVSPEHRHMAFNAQALNHRAAIVLAGPMANMGLAVLLYAVLNWSGVEQPQAVVARPVPGSLFASAGFAGGERIVRIAFGEAELSDVVSFEDLRWWLTRAVLEQHDLRIEYTDAKGNTGRLAHLVFSDPAALSSDETLIFQRIGALGPLSVAQMGDLLEDGAAHAAGLRRGDLVMRVDDVTIVDAAQLRDLIRTSGRQGATQSQRWDVQRNGVLHSFTVRPLLVIEKGVTIGRVGAYIGAPPLTVVVRYGPLEGLTRALGRTWEVSRLTLRMMGQMIIGEASLKNLSGPISIADYAGKSAATGLTQYVVFLALISISLGVLNLLPLPVLDGGHLMYYLWESVSGKPVSEFWMKRLQRVGIAMLLVMMSVAVFNDVVRLVG